MNSSASRSPTTRDAAVAEASTSASRRSAVDGRGGGRSHQSWSAARPRAGAVRESSARRRAACPRSRAGLTPAGGAASSPRRSRCARGCRARPRCAASPTSSHLSPTTNERATSSPRSRGGLLHHPRRRLAAAAFAPIPRDGAVGMVRTVIIPVHARRLARAAAHRGGVRLCTNASSKYPRAMPAWLVTTTSA